MDDLIGWLIGAVIVIVIVGFILQLFALLTIFIMCAVDLVMGGIPFLSPPFSWAFSGFILATLLHFAIFRADKLNRPNLKQKLFLIAGLISVFFILIGIIGTTNISAPLKTENQTKRVDPVSKIPTKLPYLYKQLENPVYRKAFELLFKNETGFELWQSQYIKERHGVELPGEKLEVQGKTYEFYQICRPHFCPGNVIYIFFEQQGSRAWALFTSEEGRSRFFGSPSEEIESALKAVCSKHSEASGIKTTNCTEI